MNETAPLIAALRQLHSRQIDLSLDRLPRLLAALGHPEQHLPPTIHVAGTNGKGSVVALLKAMLEAGGTRVAAYTSPPLLDLGDAITVPVVSPQPSPAASAPVSATELAACLRQVLEANAGAPLTSFEGETAAAFLAISRSGAEAAIIEAGMGGLDDATNLIAPPAAAIITPIGLDHLEFLGPTLADIARHKAGIIKDGVPVFSARQDEEAEATIETAARIRRAPLARAGRDFDAFEQHGRMVYLEHAEDVGGRLLDLPLPALRGRHQIDNAALAIAALSALGPRAPDEKAIAAGLQSVALPARLDRLGPRGLARALRAGSEIWIDGGHNHAAATRIAHYMAELEERSTKPLAIVLGMLRTKDPAAFLEPFHDLAALVVAVPVGDVSRAYARAFEPRHLADIARAAGFESESAAGVEQALQIARRLSGGPVRVLVCGSFHLAGEVIAADRAARA
ncbi:MAG: Mur ligase family protein [Hyphomicrobiaceae bacterium]